jgi:hypothetical protein
MQKPKQNLVPSKQVSQKSVTPAQHHYVRSLLAAVCGVLALGLVWATLLTVWLNHTLTNTETYVSTVGPLAQQPELQRFVAQKVADELVANIPPQELATSLLAPELVASKTPEMQAELVRTVVYDSVYGIVRAPAFTTLWVDTNRQAHAAFMTQLDARSETLTLDLNPALQGVVAEIKKTELAPLADRVQIPADAGRLHVPGQNMAPAQTAYGVSGLAAFGLVAAMVLLAALCVVLSVHHLRTALRVLFGFGVLSLLLSLLFFVPQKLLAKSGDTAEQAAGAVMGAVFGSLQTTSFWLGVVCVGGVLGYLALTAVRKRTT